jgi:uncharacterized pyridoxamine 5'-phosphate oxidase family protein
MNVIFVVAFLLFSFFVKPRALHAETGDGDKEAALKEVRDFVKGCGSYYLATVEGDQPRVRPFGTFEIFEGRLYIQTGKIKGVSKQLAANPKIEICADNGKGQWVRVQAIVVEDDRREAKQFILDAYPMLKDRYSADDGNTQVLYLKDAVVTFASTTGEPKVTEL